VLWRQHTLAALTFRIGRTFAIYFRHVFIFRPHTLKTFSIYSESHNYWHWYQVLSLQQKNFRFVRAWMMVWWHDQLTNSFNTFHWVRRPTTRHAFADLCRLFEHTVRPSDYPPGWSDFPGLIIYIPLMKYWGRQPALVVMLVIGGDAVRSAEAWCLCTTCTGCSTQTARRRSCSVRRWSADVHSSLVTEWLRGILFAFRRVRQCIVHRRLSVPGPVRNTASTMAANPREWHQLWNYAPRTNQKICCCKLVTRYQCQ